MCEPITAGATPVALFRTRCAASASPERRVSRRFARTVECSSAFAIFDDVRGVRSIAGNTESQPVPVEINGGQHSRSCRGLVWSSCGHRSERPAVTPQVSPGHSLPPRVNPQVVRLGFRALVAQGIEQRFPKPQRVDQSHGCELRFQLIRAPSAGRKPWHVCSLVRLPPDAIERWS